jgi:hypothetical protein
MLASMLTRGTRTVTCAMALSTALLLGGCGDDSGSDLPPATGASSTAAAAEKDVVAVLESFWAERVRVESSGRYDTADFSRILSTPMLEPQAQQYQQFEETGFRRVGEPKLRDYTAEVDGDKAVATVCVQEDEWGATADVKIAEPEPQGWYPSSHRLERTADAWLIVGTARAPEDVSC